DGQPVGAVGGGEEIEGLGIRRDGHFLLPALALVARDVQQELLDLRPIRRLDVDRKTNVPLGDRERLAGSLWALAHRQEHAGQRESSESHSVPPCSASSAARSRRAGKPCRLYRPGGVPNLSDNVST